MMNFDRRWILTPALVLVTSGCEAISSLVPATEADKEVAKTAVVPAAPVHVEPTYEGVGLEKEFIFHEFEYRDYQTIQVKTPEIEEDRITVEYWDKKDLSITMKIYSETQEQIDDFWSQTRPVFDETDTKSVTLQTGDPAATCQPRKDEGFLVAIGICIARLEVKVPRDSKDRKFLINGKEPSALPAKSAKGGAAKEKPRFIAIEKPPYHGNAFWFTIRDTRLNRDFKLWVRTNTYQAIGPKLSIPDQALKVAELYGFSDESARFAMISYDEDGSGNMHYTIYDKKTDKFLKDKLGYDHEQIIDHKGGKSPKDVATQVASYFGWDRDE